MNDRGNKARPVKRSRRPYEKPVLLAVQVFERTALACGTVNNPLIPGNPGMCDSTS